MRVRLVTLRYAPSLGGFDDRPLADFVRDKEVLAVREHFFTVADLPHLACLVTYQDPVLASPPAPQARAAPAERSMHGEIGAAVADLAPEDRVLFGTLREWRSARARKEGVPPYVLFTNRELLAVVRAKPKTPSALQSIDGIGAGKVERYGQAVLAVLHGAPSAAPAGAPAPAAAPVPDAAAPAPAAQGAP